MKYRDKTIVPRLPEAAREKLKTGGNHKPRKDRNRQQEKTDLRKLINDL